MTRSILAIDPGSERSAWLQLVDGAPAWFGHDANDIVLSSLRDGFPKAVAGGIDVVVVEQVESYGMAVGREVFETVWWAGRFTEAAQPLPVVQLPRRAVKLAICHDSRARDANIRAALLDRFGGSVAKGTKRSPGPLYGIAGDVWSALAIAVTYADQEAAA
jgi:hypothetical protein